MAFSTAGGAELRQGRGGGRNPPLPPLPPDLVREMGGHSDNFVTAPGASPAVCAPLPAGPGPAGGAEALLEGLWARLAPAGQPGSPTLQRPLRSAPRARGCATISHSFLPSRPPAAAHVDCVFQGRECRGDFRPMHNSGA